MSRLVGSDGVSRLSGPTASIYTGGTKRWTVNASGHLIPASPGAYDIGSTSFRAGTVYAGALDTGGGVTVGGNLVVTGSSTLTGSVNLQSGADLTITSGMINMGEEQPINFGSAGSLINLAGQLTFTGTVFSMEGEIQITGVKVLGARDTGWTLPTGTASKAGFNADAPTLAGVAQTLKALMDALYSGHGLVGA